MQAVNNASRQTAHAASVGTPARLFRAQAALWSERAALRHKQRGLWRTWTWSEYHANVRAVGLMLDRWGLRRGDVVSVLADNRPEWLFADMGAQCMGIIGSGIYPTSSAEQCRFVLTDSGARVVFVENEEQLAKILAVRDACPLLERIVVMDCTGLHHLADPQVISFAKMLEQGLDVGTRKPARFDAAIDATRPQDICFLVYTSGTTGTPKGAMISARNILSQLPAAREACAMREGEHTLSFLPLCHIAERMCTVFNPLLIGNVVHFPENSSTVFDDIREVSPHFLFAPPRFWEKLHSQVVLAMEEATPLGRWVYGRALRVGLRVADLRLAGQPVPAGVAAEHAVWRRLAFGNILSILGLEHVNDAITGAAPVPRELVRWYAALGIDLREAFGMTETSGFCSCTPRRQLRLGSAGRPMQGVEIACGPDGELLIRGPNVFEGYWNLPEQTAQTIDADGWLHTGDAGNVDDEGFVHVLDRLKDIITSGGKNIAPASIENELKLSAYIFDAVVMGEARHFLTCLVMLDHENVARFAQERQIAYTDFASLSGSSEVVQLVRGEIERVNAKLARVEQIKDFRILAQLLTAEDEELTPTMKLKRRVVTRKYEALVSSMYSRSPLAAAS